MEIKEIGNLKEGQQSWKSPQAGRVYDPKGISPTLNTCGGGGHEVKIVETKVLGGIYTDVTENFNRGLYVCNTITTVQKDNMLLEITEQYRIRKLTQKETWRLMGFSDEDYEKAAGVNSKTQLYKQAGNSIVKDVLMAIFSQLNIKGVPMWNEVHHGTK